MRKLLFSVFLASCAALAACGDSSKNEADTTGSAGNAPAEQWKFAIEEIEGSVQHQYAMEFKRRVEERSKGRIEVTVYPYGQLGTSSQITELTQLGQVQFAMASPGHLGSVIPEVQLFSLHFVFSDDEVINKEILAGNQALHDTLNAAYNDVGLELLGLFQEGWMAWTANKPLLKPEDFEGLKIRTMNSPLLIKAYELYGANPTTMAYSEVYSGLQLNMIDAQVNPVFAIEEMSFYEVQSHLMRANHLPFIASVITSPGFYNGLSEDDRKMVNEITDELGGFIFDVQRDLNQERLEVIREAGGTEIIELDDSQRDAFRKASMPIRDAYREAAGERGAKALQILINAVESAEQPAASE